MLPSPISKKREDLATSMDYKVAGPMPVDRFFGDLMPVERKRRKQYRKTLFHGIPINQSENSVYNPYIETVNNNNLMPDFTMVNTSYHYDLEEPGDKVKPDPSVYLKEGLDLSQRKTQFDRLELHSELKPYSSQDAFCDSPDNTPEQELRTWEFRHLSKEGRSTRGQLIHYGTQWLARQHRNHGFTIFSFGQYARFLRWDCAGTIVSQKFNYKEDSSSLVEFFWRFSRLGAAGRGHDPTARRASDEEATIAKRELREWAPTDLNRPIFAFTVEVDNGETREFLGWGSLSDRIDLTGRCTRAYPVYEIASQTKYFLKDAWRAQSLMREAEILKTLTAAGVEHVPIYICGDDIPGGVTKTDLYIKEEEYTAAYDDDNAIEKVDYSAHDGDAIDNDYDDSSNADDESMDPEDDPGADDDDGVLFESALRRDGSWKCGNKWTRITKRFHHRFVTDVIGKPFRWASNSKVLLQASADAFKAHEQAVKAGVLHRDISESNILITESGRGILNDWDMAIYLPTDNDKDTSPRRPRRHERTGTWEFMSTLLVNGHHMANTIQDDMESFVLVILYHALRYFPHNKKQSTEFIIDEVFNKHLVLPDGQHVGREARGSLFLNMYYIGQNFEMDCQPLNHWIKAAISAVKEWIEGEMEDVPTLPAFPDRLAAIKKIPPPPPDAFNAERYLLTHTFLDNVFTVCLGLPDWLPDEPLDMLKELEEERETKKRGYAPPDADNERASKRSKKSGLQNAGPSRNAKSSQSSLHDCSSGIPTHSSSRMSSGMATRSLSRLRRGA
ncbi:hypothetical protein H0H87_009274 [Tephrocybe sp. NHM501043]|nr:hypothetical protein H0H87_009274 [Tephrocybe sp. NHM501043]